MEKGKIKKILFYSLIIFVGLALTILFYFMLNNQTSAEPWTKKIAHILRPFVIGGVIAYIMKSTCNFFERIYKKGLLKKGKRSEDRAESIASKLSIVTTCVIWTAAVVGLVAIIINPLINSVKNLLTTLFENVPKYADSAIEFVHDKLSGNPQIEEFFEDAINTASDNFNKWIEHDLNNYVGQIGSGLISGVTDVVVLIKDILIGLVVSCLFLASRKILAEKSKMIINSLFKENAANTIIDEFRYADKMFSGFLEGKIIGSTLLGIVYYITLVIMDVPYAPLIAVFCGVTNIIPIFGPFIGAIPSAIIILTADPVKVIPFIIFVCIMQFIDGYIIDPHIVGGNMNMSVLGVLFAVTLFGGLWGFGGLLVGVPVFAVLYDIAEKIVIFFLKKKGKDDLIEDFRRKFPVKKERKRKKLFAAAGNTNQDIESDTDDTVTVDEQPDPVENGENEAISDADSQQ